MLETGQALQSRGRARRRCRAEGSGVLGARWGLTIPPRRFALAWNLGFVADRPAPLAHGRVAEVNCGEQHRAIHVLPSHLMPDRPLLLQILNLSRRPHSRACVTYSFPSFSSVPHPAPVPSSLCSPPWPRALLSSAPAVSPLSPHPACFLPLTAPPVSGLSAAHTIYLSGGNVVLLDKNSKFPGGVSLSR